VHGELLSVDDVLARIEAVTLDDVHEVARDVLSRPLALGVLGPFRDKDFSEAIS
jgi:predicted Zn-dependent peptidase